MHNFLSSCKITDLIVKTDSVSFCISIFIEMETETVLIMVNYMTEGTQIEGRVFGYLNLKKIKHFDFITEFQEIASLYVGFPHTDLMRSEIVRNSMQF